MTILEVTSMVKSIGLPCAYYQFPNNTEQELPVICYYFPEDRDLYADDKMYFRAGELVLELYSKTKRFDLEEKIEAALEAQGLAYTRDEKNYPEEKLIVEVYRMFVPLEHDLLESEREDGDMP